VQAVVALLESDGYPTAEALAKDVIKTVADLLDSREWYALAWRDKAGPGALSLAWGVFSSENECTKFATKLSIGGTGRAIKLYSADEMLDRLDVTDAAGRLSCTTCGHPHGTHQHERRIGQCQVQTAVVALTHRRERPARHLTPSTWRYA
jgi:hypothetical protein